MTSPAPTPALTWGQVQDLLLDSTPYLPCGEVFDRLDVYVEALVADPEHQDGPINVHLRACRACAEDAATLHEFVAEPTSGESQGIPGERNL